MTKLRIENESYYHALIIILGVMLLYNLVTSFSTQNALGLIPIAIQSGLIFLLISKNSYSQMAIKIWIIIVFFFAQAMKILGIGLISLGDFMKNEDVSEVLSSNKTILSLVFIIFGIILWILNKHFGVVISEEEV